ncbi:hypothetical protein M3Y99_01752300 [Aphelenchoides fujianensis]|nr:hypothetical protein M3Y99_01752300 [Aphelenchoides fujianensis]
MGWRPALWFSCDFDCAEEPADCLNELLYVEMADALFLDGFRKAGYTLLHVDDCVLERAANEDGRVAASRRRFPSGIRFLSNYFHERHLDFGITRGPQRQSCASKSRRDRFSLPLAKLLDLRTDFVEMNTCEPTQIRRMSRTMLVFCNGNQPKEKKYPPKFCDVFRPPDLPPMRDDWRRVSAVIDYAIANRKKLAPVRRNAKWIDFGELTIGNQGLTVGQSRIQMSFWCMWSAPLMMSADLRSLDGPAKKILLNEDAIDIDQDELGEMAEMVLEQNGLQFFLKRIEPCDANRTICAHALAIVNRSNRMASASFKLEQFGWNHVGPFRMRNVWTPAKSRNLSLDEEFVAAVPPMDVLLFKVLPLGGRAGEWPTDRKPGRQSIYATRNALNDAAAAAKRPLPPAAHKSEWFASIASLLFGWEFVWLFGVSLAASVVYCALFVERRQFR